MSAPAMNIEQRVTVSLALQRYLRAVERFEAASNEFNRILPNDPAGTSS